jgi:hypothetical protein
VKKHRDSSFLSMSFLDLLACALGAVLVLLLISAAGSRQSTETYRSSLADMHQRMADSLGRLADVQQALADAVARNRELQDAADASVAQAQAQSDALRRAAEAIRQTQTQLVGLKGPLRNTVFVFDTSGSMDTPRFDEYRQTLQSWINYLPLERFAVIDFDSTVRVFQEDFVDATPDMRAAAREFIDGFRADGRTDTRAALDRALAMEGVDTIVLFSDGAPTAPYPAHQGQVSVSDIQQNISLIEQWLRESNRSRGVVINCVAMGQYFNTAYGEFLQRVARDHNGVFIGR